MSESERPIPEGHEPAGAVPQDTLVPVDADADVASQADELLMHGLLSVLHERAGGAGERRVARVLEELRETSKTAAIAGTTGRVSRRPGKRLRRFVGVPVLALAVVFGSWAMLQWPGHQAKAAVMASVSAVNGPGNRRYEVRLMRGTDEKLPEKPEAVFDSHDGGNYLLRAHNPFGGVVIAGQDEAGEWAIRLDGGIERSEPRKAWPRWSTDRGESLLAEPVGELMKSMAGDYRLSDLGVQPREGKRLRRITAVRRSGTPPHLADRVELWIDADSRLLERMEMNWDRPKGDELGRGPGGPGPGMGPGAGPGMGPGGPDGSRGGRPPLDGPGGRERLPRPDGPEARRLNQDGPGGDDQGPMGLAPGRVPPDDAGPAGEREARPGPRGDGPSGDGPVGGDGPPRGPGGPGGPRGPGPMKVIRQLVIQRVEAPTWAADWFAPEGHKDGKWGEPE